MWEIKRIKNEYHINTIKPNYRVSVDLPQKLKAKKKKGPGKNVSIILKISEIKSQAMARNDQRTKVHVRKAVITHDSLKLKKRYSKGLYLRNKRVWIKCPWIAGKKIISISVCPP